MLPDLPQLHILPIDALVLHEDHDLQRTQPLVDKLRAQGILRNPPVVTPLEDGTDRYLVLDGANRVTSIKTLEFPHIVAQVARPDDPNVRLLNWNHVVWGLKGEKFLQRIREIPDLHLKPLNLERPNSPGECAPVYIQMTTGKAFMACTSVDPARQVSFLHAIVNSYKDRASLDRTNLTDIRPLISIYPDLTALVIFPEMTVREVLEHASRGHILPAGITRFTISPRALHLNYPLHELSSGKQIQEKEAYLQKWIQERIKHKNVRYYAEETFLFDE